MNKRSTAAAVATVGICAAIIECGKIVLAALPNIEVVTLLVALFGYTFGWAGVLSTVIFVMLEPIIWGFGAWCVSYFIYWPLVAVVFMLFGRGRVDNRLIFTASAVLLTVFFGLLTSFVDLLFYSQSFDNFFVRFFAYYLHGVVFYILQVSCNAVLFLFAFRPLLGRLKKISKRD